MPYLLPADYSNYGLPDSTTARLDYRRDRAD